MEKQMRNRNGKHSKLEKGQKEKRLYILLFGGVLFIVFSIVSMVIIKMDFFQSWNEGIAPFVFYFLNYVFFVGVLGGLSLITGVVLPIWSTYMILTGKAFAPTKLIAPVTLLTLFCLGFAYLCLGTGWLDSASDVKTYFQEGAREKTIVLKDYEIDIDYRRNSGATDFIYTTSEGEEFTTQTDFGPDLYLNEKYIIRYLPKTKYIIEIKPY